MKRILTLVCVSLAALAAASIVQAARPNSYTLTLVSVSEGVASFAVTRETLANEPSAWVYAFCVDGNGNDLPATATPVLWGLWSSYTGEASVGVSGSSCSSFVTIHPWKPRPYSNVVSFLVG